MKEQWKIAFDNYYKLNFTHRVAHIFHEARSVNKSCFWIVSPSGYLFKTGNAFWGMDLRIPNGSIISQKLLEDLDFVVITHAHSDHLDKNFISAIGKTNVPLILPYFAIDRFNQIVNSFYPACVEVKPQTKININEIEIEAFESLHYRKNNGAGTDELGYRFSHGDNSILFPGDIRDYSPSKLNTNAVVDCVFAHVWLGDDSSLSEYEMLDDYANFYNYFSPKKVVLTHLYATDRQLSKIWTYMHAGMIIDEFLSINPYIDACVPRLWQRNILF